MSFRIRCRRVSFGSFTIHFKEYGVRLSFTPTVLGGDLINLKIKPEVSSLDFDNAVVIEGFRIPALTSRRAETEVELQDGQTFAIAGLLNNSRALLHAEGAGPRRHPGARPAVQEPRVSEGSDRARRHGDAEHRPPRIDRRVVRHPLAGRAVPRPEREADRAAGALGWIALYPVKPGGGNDAPSPAPTPSAPPVIANSAAPVQDPVPSKPIQSPAALPTPQSARRPPRPRTAPVISREERKAMAAEAKRSARLRPPDERGEEGRRGTQEGREDREGARQKAGRNRSQGR